MTEQEQKVEHKEGRPWTNLRTFSSFEEADRFRKNCLNDTTKHTKVKKQTTSTGTEVFVVKQRTLEDESVVPEKQNKKNKKKV
jgi:hypothetical protein